MSVLSTTFYGNFFYTCFDSTRGYSSVTFDCTKFLTVEEVLEILGVEITEEIVSLIPEFFEFLARNYVDYVEGSVTYLACPNYIDFVIRFFRYELVEKPALKD